MTECPTVLRSSNLNPIKVLSAPDYRQFVPYQEALARALQDFEVMTSYPERSGGLAPLKRSCAQARADVLHLHWPEHYFLSARGISPLRYSRFWMDLYLARIDRPVALTVHDAFPTQNPDHWACRAMSRYVARSSAGLIVHSHGAAEVLRYAYRLPERQLVVIPHGDLSVCYGPPRPADVARRSLGLDDRPICLAFGTILPNKGLLPLVRYWKKHRPTSMLAIVGRPSNKPLADQLREWTSGEQNIHLDLSEQSDDRINLWFSASDCAVVNYSEVFTSGVACLSRSWGLPLLLRKQLVTVDVGEPDDRVLRYDDVETDFGAVLAHALKQKPSFEAAASWRSATSWAGVAHKTASFFRNL